MSRIDEALRRAREREAEAAPQSGTTPSAPASAERAQPAIPPADLFRAPWKFDADAADAGEPAASTSLRVLASAGPLPSEGQPPSRSSREQEVVQADGPAVLGSGAPMALFKGFDERIAERLVVSPHARNNTVEQYRKLAGTLHHAQIERNIRSLVIASALPGEGKTLTATNLALTLAESFRRNVLLVDADLRRPSLHEVFQVPNLTGLSEGLKAEADQRLSIIQILPTLSLLTAGRPDADPMSGLSSPRIRRIVEEGTSRFDWVIIDTPPIGLMPDAHLLSNIVDTALLVIQAGSTPYEMVIKALEVIGRERVLGVVLNRAEEGIHFGRYDRYYSYYRSRGGRSDGPG